MGLDMFARRVGASAVGEAQVDFEIADAAAPHDNLHYWRKHPNLHGWMQKLYVEKGGNPDPDYFNCVNLRLTAEDLALLEGDIKTNALPSTSGFFFGQTDGSEFQDDLAFIAKARAAIAEGDVVFYTSWW